MVSLPSDLPYYKPVCTYADSSKLAEVMDALNIACTPSCDLIGIVVICPIITLVIFVNVNRR
jgi:hypothetical protein